MKTLLKTFLVFCFYSFACAVFAADITTADKFFDQGKFREALQIYLQPEYRDDSYIQNRIGYIYQTTEFREDKKAVEWYRKSANQGNMHGQYNLGLMYKKGSGVAQDYQQALQWFSKAAEQGNMHAMNSIGNLYNEGAGVEKDAVKAGNWYVEAARKGNRDGNCNAAGLLMHSKNVEQDYASAHILLEHCLKSDPNDDCCLERMAVLYSKGWGVEQDRKKAHELRTKAATNGNAVAMYMLAGDFDYGIGVKKNPKAAMEWYVKAAEKGESYAMYRLYEGQAGAAGGQGPGNSMESQSRSGHEGRGRVPQ